MNKISTIVLFLLVCSSITGSAVFIGVEELQFFRIMVGLSIGFAIYILSIKRIYIDKEFKFFLIFFLVDFIWGTTVALYNVTLELNNCINELVLFLLLISLIVFGSNDNMKFVKSIYNSSIAMFFIMLTIAIWEIITQNHLSISALNNAPIYQKFVPSTFFTNQNDFMAVMTLIFLFVTNMQTHLKTTYFLVIFMIISNLVLSFITGSRINLIVTLMIIATFWLNPKRLILLSIIALTLISLILTNTDFFKDNFGMDLDYLLNGLNLGGDSTSIRASLYEKAFYSIESSYGFGYGLNNSSLYYTSLHDNVLEGMINPHNYLLEILINGGLVVFLLYCAFLVYIFAQALKKQQYKIFLSFIYYFIILMSSSSSLFLWYHYIFFIGIIYIAKYDKLAIYENRRKFKNTF